MRLLVITTALNRSKLHNETFKYYSKMLKGHEVDWIINIDRVDDLRDTNKRTRINIKRVTGMENKKFHFITTNQGWFNRAVRNVLEKSKEFIDKVDAVLYLEDDWIPIIKNNLPNIENIIKSSVGENYKDKEFLVCLSERIWLTNQYINFQPQLWSPKTFKKFIEVFDNDGRDNVSPERLLEKGFYEKYTLHGIVKDRYKFFKDAGRDWMKTRGIVKRHKDSNNYAGENSMYKKKEMKFESYEDYVKKCQRIDTGWNASEFTMDVNGEAVGVELPDNYNETIEKIRGELQQRLDDGRFRNDVRGIVSLIDDPLDIPEVIELGGHFAKELSEKLYGGPCYVTYVHPYRNNMVNEREGASWIWHYDNVAPGIIKILIYLTPTNKNNGAFLTLRNDKGEYPLIKPSTYSPNRYVRPEYKDSRLTSKQVKEFKDKGYKEFYIEGDAGTFLLFNNNILHKATIPKELPERMCIIYHFRPYYKDLKYTISKELTGDWSDNSRVKSKKYEYLSFK